MDRSRIVVICVLAFNLAFLPSHSWASDVAPQIAGLGQVHFANSCSPKVQAELNAGIAMLHSFQYGLAEKTFTYAAQEDPQCAMAYWGAAMTLYHQLWDWPTAGTLQKGRQYLSKARRLKKKTARELAYLQAAEAFYQPAQQLGSMSRTQAYSNAMLRIHLGYPEDDDATAFYALSLLAMESEGVEDLTNDQEAITLLTKLVSARPEHPGAAHYLIHATDTAALAPLGLDAARNYARIAPGSPHALHMPSHIFARLGMWQESIESNLASISAAREASTSHRDDAAGDELHAMMYLQYSYLQSGNEEAARHVVESVKEVPGATAIDIINNQSVLEALYAVETHTWEKAAALPDDPGELPYARMRTYWARAIGAAHQGDLLSARQNIEKLDQARAGVMTHIRVGKCQMHAGYTADAEFSVQQLEARAWLAWAEGSSAAALEMMRSAANKEESYGVESRGVPAYELLGDLLLELGQPEPALVAYSTALKEAPLRFNALAGAARASRAVGDWNQARSYYALLIKCCDPLAKRAEVREARLFLSGN